MKSRDGKENSALRQKSSRRHFAALPKKILCTTDFSDESLVGVRYGIALAKKLGAAVALVHAVELNFPAPGIEAAVLADMAAAARLDLEKLIKRETGNKLEITPFVPKGTAFREINAVARKWAADLIVIATHGRTGLKHIALGSTAEQVVRYAPCPVVTIPTREGFKTIMKPFSKLKKILVPIDFSETSKQAMYHAVSIAQIFRAKISLLHVIELLPISRRVGVYYANFYVPNAKEERRRSEAQLMKLSKQIIPADISTQIMVHEGTPFHDICMSTETLSADLIVLTTHGHTGIKRLLFGSTAERIIRHAKIPVLAIRDKKRASQ